MADAPESTPKPRRGIVRRLLRWTWRGVVVVVVLLLLVRASLPLWLPSILDRVGASAGVEITLGDLDLRLLHGDVELRDLVVAVPREDGTTETLADIDYLGADLAMRELLGGRVHLRRVSIGRAELTLERAAGGTWNLPSPPAAEDKGDEVEADAPASGPADFRLPVTIDRFDLSALRLVVDDAARDRYLFLEATAEATDLGHLTETGFVRFDVRSPGLFSDLRVAAHLTHPEVALDGAGATPPRALELAFEGLLTDLDPEAIAQWLPHVAASARELDGELRGNVRLAPLDMHGRARAEIHVEKLRARALGRSRDSESQLGVFEWSAEWGPDGTRLGRLQLDGLVFEVGRSVDGQWRALGFETLAAAATPEPVPDDMQLLEPRDAESSDAESPDDPPQQAAQPEPEPPSAPEEPVPFAIDGLELTGARLVFDDDLMAVELEVDVARLVLDPITLGEVGAAPFALELAAPGVFEALVLEGTIELLEDGAARVFGSLAVSALEPTVLAPYLAAAGIAWDAPVMRAELGFDAGFHARADGGIGLDVELTGGQPNTPYFGFERIAVTGFELDAAGDISIEAIEVRGIATRFEREADGALHIGALRLGGADPVAVAPAEAAPEPTSDDPAGGHPSDLPRVQLGAFTFDTTALAFTDHTLSPPLELAPSRFRVQLEGLDLFGPEASHAPFDVTFAVPGLLEDFAIQGALVGQPPTSLEADLAVRATGFATERLTPYLEAAGVLGAIEEGALALDLDARLELGEDGVAFDATLADLAVTTAAGPVASLERISLAGASTGAGLALEPLTIEAPRFELTRGEHLEVGGLVLGPAPAAEAAPLERFDPEAAPEPAAEPAPDTPDAPSGPAVALAGLTLSGAEVVVHDARLATPLRATLDLAVGALDLANPAETALDLTVGLPGRVERAAFDLVAVPDLVRPRVAGQFRLDGIEPAGLRELLPPNVAVDLTRGELAFDLAASADLAAGEARDGMGLDVTVTDLALRDGDVTALSFDRLALVVPEVSKTRLHVADLAFEGLRAAAHARPNGDLALPGLTLLAASDAGVSDDPAADPAADPAEEAVEEAPAPLQRPWRPVVALDRARFDIAQLGFRSGDAEPVDLALVFATTTPFEHDPHTDPEDDAAPIVFELQASAAPVLTSLHALVDVDPFAIEPLLSIELGIEGLSGPALTRSLPDLAASLDASAVESGRLHAKLESALKVRRRGPLEFDFESGIGGDFELSGLTWAPTADGEPVLGLARLAGELKRADAEGMSFETLEIEHPLGRLTWKDDGLHVGGFRIPAANEADEPAAVTSAAEDGATPPPTTEVATEATTATEATASAETPDEAEGPGDDDAPVEQVTVAEVSTPLPPVQPENAVEVEANPPFRVDVRELFATGLDLVVRDERVQPPMVLPLDDFEAEIRGLSSAALDSPEPIAFTIYVGAGDIELPKRSGSSNLVTGLFGKLGGVINGGDKDAKTEQRPAFGGLDVSGRITLAPQPTGWATLELIGVELENFSGLTSESSVELNDGLLETKVDVRLLGDRGTSISSSTRAEHLSLTEPVGGPISSFLKLPAPLDTVLYLLRDEDGAQVLDLNFRVTPEGGLDGLLTAISTTLAKLIGEAIASSPARLVGGVLDFTGLLDEEEVELPEELFAVTFQPAGSEPAQPALLAEVKPILDLLRAENSVEVDLVHVFTDADFARLATVTRPDREACLELAGRLRRERDALVTERDALAVDLRADYALGVTLDRTDKHAQLANLDAELALVEDSLDAMLEFVGPGGDRRASRRVRAAALMIAEARLESVRTAIRHLPIQSIGERVRVRRARYSEQVAAPTGGRVYVLPRR